LRDHGWFVFFAPRDNPRIAGVVFAEHGEHGGNAAVLAHHVLETFFAKEAGKPLPPVPTSLPLTLTRPPALPQSDEPVIDDPNQTVAERAQSVARAEDAQASGRTGN
jgi:penicillin-binding protein 2